MIEVTCANCKLTIQVPPSVQGRRGVCFGCGAPLTVPKAAAAVNGLSLEFAEGARVADRYIVKSRLGKGGMGVVYLATDTLLHEDVALKFMNPRMLRTQKGQQFFIQEAQIARRLRHENIVAVHDVGCTSDGILYLSMEFVPGRPLRDIVRQQRLERKYLPVRLGITLLEQVLLALHFAHKHVVHRDIKPENVMVLPGERVKVLDFGLAKALDEESELAQAPSKQRPVIGTLAYAAPEQKAHRAVDLRADIYAAGLLLHELLTLRTPLDPPVRVDEVRKDVAPSVVEVLRRALEPEKDDRWQSAEEFRQALLEAFRASYATPAADGAVTPNAGSASLEDMVYQEGGSFLMGSNQYAEEQPEHEVYVDPFYIDRHPVTVSQYRRFIEETGAAPPRFWGVPEYSGPNQPVVGVTWEEAAAYAAWAGKQLPTEAQWEFAARGKANRKYPWGNLDPDNLRANYGDHLNTPSIVGMHDDGHTPEGVIDMAGNVYEWCQEWYRGYGDDPVGPLDTPRRVARGGSWHSSASTLRCSHRFALFPESRLPTVGFRCVASAPS